MKLKLALLAVVAGFSLAANAQTETRQEVKAEAKAANQAGAIGHGEVNAPQPKAAKSTMTRAEGRDKARAANKSGQVQTGEGGSK